MKLNALGERGRHRESGLPRSEVELQIEFQFLSWVGSLCLFLSEMKFNNARNIGKYLALGIDKGSEKWIIRVPSGSIYKILRLHRHQGNDVDNVKAANQGHEKA